MVISFENVNPEVSTDDKTLLTDTQRFICMFFEDIIHIRRTAAHLVASGRKAGLDNDIVEKLEQIIDTTEEISQNVSETMTDVIPRPRTNPTDWS